MVVMTVTFPVSSQPQAEPAAKWKYRFHIEFLVDRQSLEQLVSGGSHLRSEGKLMTQDAEVWKMLLAWEITQEKIHWSAGDAHGLTRLVWYSNNVPQHLTSSLITTKTSGCQSETRGLRRGWRVLSNMKNILISLWFNLLLVITFKWAIEELIIGFTLTAIISPYALQVTPLNQHQQQVSHMGS